MEKKRFMPHIDWINRVIFIIAIVLLLGLTVEICLFPEPLAICLVIPLELIVLYLLISPFFGYVELRENTVFIKFGLILKKEIPFSVIRGAERVVKTSSDSIISLKTAFEHINIKYNRYDVVSVSIKDGDEFIAELEKIIMDKQPIF